MTPIEFVTRETGLADRDVRSAATQRIAVTHVVSAVEDDIELVTTYRFPKAQVIAEMRKRSIPVDEE